jgi:hypothetical protein
VHVKSGDLATDKFDLSLRENVEKDLKRPLYILNEPAGILKPRCSYSHHSITMAWRDMT